MENSNEKSMVNSRFRQNDIDDDVAFAKRIITNEKEAVAFFLETYSKPLMEYVGRRILKLKPLPVYKTGQGDISKLEQYEEYSYGVSCYGAYYLFIAAIINGMTPQWDKLRYYAENPRSPFYTYLSVITTRYFLKHHPDREKPDKKDKEKEISSYDENERLYLMLCLKLQDKDEEVLFTEDMYKELETAHGMLKAKDALIIELTCFSDMTTMEIAEEMKDDFESDLSTMSRKDIQTRISQWKNRAFVRLSGIITAEKNKSLFPSLLEYARKKQL